MSDQKNPQIVPRMLITITKEEDEKKLEEVFDSLQIPICFQGRGKGTAPSEIMDILGLRGTNKLLTLICLPKSKVGQVFEAIQKQLSFHQKGGGIAITIPVIGLQNNVMNVLHKQSESISKEKAKGEEKEMSEKAAYAAIWVSVANGFSDDVVDAARSAGAKGGTIMKGRRRTSENVSQHFGISMQDEQDFVMIVVPREHKNEVMSAIMEKCGLHTEAHGIVLSLPVDEVMGLTN